MCKPFIGKTVYIHLKNQQSALKGELDDMQKPFSETVRLDGGRTIIQYSEIAAITLRYSMEDD